MDIGEIEWGDTEWLILLRIMGSCEHSKENSGSI
jgi:hypothetical protein